MNTRKKIIAGNWKMNLSLSEGTTLATAVKKYISNEDTAIKLEKTSLDIIVAPNYLALNTIQNLAIDSPLKIAAQNVYFENNGAFTGEVSVTMLKDIGITHCIIGHSERRSVLGENDEVINKKLLRLNEYNLTPILCIGETLTERKENQWREVIAKQLELGLSGLSEENIAKAIIAYEPVWAIGTGVSASPEQAQEVHAYIRKRLQTIYSTIGDKNSIIYGGSLNTNNAVDLFAQPDIDGGLIGGASLKINDFNTVIQTMLNLNS